jgi:hypothetical protein
MADQGRHHPSLHQVAVMRNQNRLFTDRDGREYGTVKDENGETLWFVHLPNIDYDNSLTTSEAIVEPREQTVVQLLKKGAPHSRVVIIEYPEDSPQRTKIVTLKFLSKTGYAE